MMNSEWIEKLRAAAAMCRSPDDDLDYKYWAAVAFDMLPKASAYIGQQAASLDEAEALIKKNADQINTHLARIAELETQIDLLQNEVFELRKGKDSQKVISELMAWVAALQEIAGEERAKYNLSWKDCIHRAPDTYCEKTHNYCTSEDCPLLEEQKTEARRQLAKEHPEAFR